MFAALLLCQIVGYWASIRAGAIEVRTDGFVLRAPVHLGWLFLLGYGVGSALLTTLVLVPLYDTVFPKGLPRKSMLVRFSVWLLCVFLSFLVWHLIK